MRDQALKAEISRVHEDNYCVLGARKMHAMLNRPESRERHGLGHAAPAAPRVRLMRAMGLHGHRPRQITAYHAQRS
ncbi:IS3 family transposase [Actinomyces qiguomingii]|uniref:IS3 family transposase n=1 Tax=Actinomyces qiguomingii TaxID=2057800 RepID=UPI001304EBF0